MMERLKRALSAVLGIPARRHSSFFGVGMDTLTGINITQSTAMRYTAVYACVNLLARTVGSLPLNLYHRLLAGGKEKARNHPLFRLIRHQPNPEMTAMRYRSTLQGHLATHGNAYSYIDWAGNGYPGALWPLNPDSVRVQRINSELVYRYFPSSGDAGPDAIRAVQGISLSRTSILHIPGFGFDGIKGFSPITLAREAIGLGLAAESFGARFFGHGTHPSWVIEHPGKLSIQAESNLKESLHKANSTLGKSHLLMILEEGMKANKITVDPRDSQFLETRKFQVAEIARIFLVPPHMIADLDRATFSNIEEMGIEFVVHTMQPWLVLWEQELDRCLLLGDEREKYFFQFDVDALMRGDIQKRYAAYAIGKQWGFLSTNDIRNRENMNPIPGGDAYMVPLNMAEAKKDREEEKNNAV